MGIISAVKEFIVNRGLTLMLIGISTAVVGVALCAYFFTPRYAGLPYPRIAVGVAVVGFVVYFVGRVSVYMQRRDNRRTAMELISRRDDDEVTAAAPPRQDGDGAEFLPKNDNESGAK